MSTKITTTTPHTCCAERTRGRDRNRILYEDRDIIVCHKAAGIATQTARVGQADMVSEVRNYLSRSVGGVPYVGVVHRLDQPVEGILVFAKNKKAAAGLSGQIAGEQTEKYYYAVVCGRNFDRQGDLEDYLLKDGRTNLSSVVPPGTKDAKRAFLHYEIVASKALPAAEPDAYEIALARIRLYTGRHHQIRVQMSHAGMSLLGDHKYADAETIRISAQRQVKEVALCAYRISFFHPVTEKRMEFQIRPEGKSFQTEEWYNAWEMQHNRREIQE